MLTYLKEDIVSGHGDMLFIQQQSLPKQRKQVMGGQGILLTSAREENITYLCNSVHYSNLYIKARSNSIIIKM